MPRKEAGIDMKHWNASDLLSNSIYETLQFTFYSKILLRTQSKPEVEPHCEKDLFFFIYIHIYIENHNLLTHGFRI